MSELTSEDKLESRRIRKKGGGRKKITVNNPNIIKELESLIEPTTCGDPESLLRWTSKSTYKLAVELSKKGYKASQRTVCDLLKNELEYSLQANRKTREGGDNPDRDAQFEYINKKTKQFQNHNQPVISVDTKKRRKI